MPMLSVRGTAYPSEGCTEMARLFALLFLPRMRCRVGPQPRLDIQLYKDGKDYMRLIRKFLHWLWWGNDEPPAFSIPPSKNLACWCPLDQPCHADVLLEIANREER